MPLNPSLQLQTFGALQCPWMQGLLQIAKTHEYNVNRKHNKRKEQSIHIFLPIPYNSD